LTSLPAEHTSFHDVANLASARRLVVARLAVRVVVSMQALALVLACVFATAPAMSMSSKPAAAQACERLDASTDRTSPQAALDVPVERWPSQAEGLADVEDESDDDELALARSPALSAADATTVDRAAPNACVPLGSRFLLERPPRV
jgi:hypothetical protein